MGYAFDSGRYDKMVYRRCGNSGLRLPVLSLGCWQNFGDTNDEDMMREMLRFAFDAGITHFDLANNYGPPPGSAERNFGKLFQEDFEGHRDEIIISTKAGYHMWPGPYGEWGSRKYLIASLDQSLKRMGLDYVDVFYSHRPDPETPLEETMGALDAVVRQGKALYVAISNYSPEQTQNAVRILRELGTPCLMNQVNYSMLNRRIENGLLAVHERENVSIMAFGALAQGQLTDRYLDGVPDTSRVAKNEQEVNCTGLNRDQIEKQIAKVRELHALAKERGQSLAQMAMAWVLRWPQVTSALIGASSVSQLEENLGLLDNLDFSREELERIDNLDRELAEKA